MSKDRFLRTVNSGIDGATNQEIIAFSSRIALRMLPLVTVEKKKLPFHFWRKGIKERHLLILLRSLVLGQTMGAGLSLDRDLVRSIYNQIVAIANDVDDIIVADPADEYQASTRPTSNVAITIAAYVLFAATYATAAAAGGDFDYEMTDYASFVADYAHDATSLAYAAAATIPPILNDANIMGLEKSVNIYDLPLFAQPTLDAGPSVGTYQQWEKAWLNLQASLLALSHDFDLWITWLNDRYAGKLWDASEGLCWIDYPPEVEAGGVSEVKAYILNRLSQKASKPLNQIRTIFIGYGNTGKTSIIRCLHDEPVNKEEDMTPGVAIRESPLAGNGLTTLFWDFGGQVIAHATHQFFLRSSCVYVLVLTARDVKNLTDDAEYWLQHVRAFGRDAPVLIVGNKSEAQRVSLERKSLTDKYPNIVGFFDISCWHLDKPAYREQFDNFKQALCTQLRSMSLHQMMFTPDQFAVLNTVKQLSREKSLLPYAEFDRLCAQHHIAAQGVQDRDWLMKTLDQLGVVIHFPQLPWVNDFVLNPRWLTWAVYTLMYGSQATIDVPTIKQTLKENPVHDETGKLLTFDDDKLRFIADAMVEFKLCYRLQSDEHRYVIPSLLATELSAALQRNAWDKEVTLAYRMVFKSFVPRHLMPQLIVRRNQEIANNHVCQKAVLLRHPKYQVDALLEVDYADRELFILLKGKQAKEYLYELRLMIVEVLQNIKVERVEEVRLPEVTLLPGETMRRLRGWSNEWANIKRLENMHRHGEAKYYSDQQVYELANLVAMFFAQQQLTDLAQA